MTRLNHRALATLPVPPDEVETIYRLRGVGDSPHCRCYQTDQPTGSSGVSGESGLMRCDLCNGRYRWTVVLEVRYVTDALDGEQVKEEQP